jgi:hypothetical protein
MPTLGIIDMKLLWLIDNLDYIRGNCFQHQIQKTLSQEFDVTYANLNTALTNRNIDLDSFDKIFCSMKARTVFGNIDGISGFLKGREVILYDQDPWEGFVDDGPYKGSYRRALDNLNVKSFFITSKWWADYVREKTGAHTTFVQMGILPEYCQWIPWEERRVEIGFKGKLHPHRKRFFDDIRNHGIDVEIDTHPSGYTSFLDALSYYGIYLHSEERTFMVEGKKIPYNGVWIKEVEAASQGCFVLRDYEDESLAYGVNKIPTINTFRSTKEAVEKVQWILDMPIEEKNRMTEAAVDQIRSQNSWSSSLAKLIKEA